jgi:hypothetical protein
MYSVYAYIIQTMLFVNELGANNPYKRTRLFFITVFGFILLEPGQLSLYRARAKIFLLASASRTGSGNHTAS